MFHPPRLLQGGVNSLSCKMERGRLVVTLYESLPKSSEVIGLC